MKTLSLSRRAREGRSRWCDLSRSLRIKLLGREPSERPTSEPQGTTSTHDALCEDIRQLAESNRRKDEYLATLAHELRNPLAAIRGAVEVLSAERGMDQASLLACAVLDRQSRHMARLIEDLLDVRRLVHGKVELQKTRVDLRQLVSDVLDDISPRVRERSLSLNRALCRESLWLDADVSRLVQVLDNLLVNAIKFNQPQGTIDVELRRDGELALLRVRDTGIGIGADVLPRIFDAFEQAAPDAPRRGGLGLGLAIVKTLVELHEGSVSVYSDGLGQGTEFEVRLRIARVSRPPYAAPVCAQLYAR